jgi:PAS domain S-box-containing protein
MHVTRVSRERPRVKGTAPRLADPELVATQDRLREAHEVARLSSWEWRPDSNKVFVFQALVEKRDLSGASLNLDALLGGMSLEDRAIARADLAEMVSGEREVSNRRHRYALPGGPAWIETRTRAIRDRDGRLSSVRGTSQEVTEQHLATQELADGRDFFQATLDSLPTEIAVLDQDGQVIMCNLAWSALAAANDVAGGAELGFNYLGACDAAENELAGLLGSGLREIMAGARAVFTIEYPRHDPGPERWFVLRAARYEGSGPARVVIARDEVSGRRTAELESLQSQRSLLAARNYLSAVADGMGEGLCTTDTKGRIVYINDAAERLLGWSGELARGRAMHGLVHSRHHDGSEFPAGDCPILRASQNGVAIRVEDDQFLCRDGTVLPVAYTAAPFVTDDGIVGCAVVFKDITERKAREQTMERDVDALAWLDRIRSALAEDRFELYAQPILDLRSGAVVQRELLLRMRARDGTIIAPGSYLPFAEQYGLIADIDRWVVERATEIAARLGPVQLNLSATSIGNPTIVDWIELCLLRTGADPASLVIEITETALIADEASAKVFADRLHLLGCRLALDDFGTGYGGFTYLKQLPVDLLKIDVEFVRDLSTNDASRHVVTAVVALARAFGLQTVAEGVEDATALDMIRELGVDFGQGYHIARPAPIGQPFTTAMPAVLISPALQAIPNEQNGLRT